MNNENTQTTVYRKVVKYTFNAIRLNNKPYTLDGKNELRYPIYHKYCMENDTSNLSEEEIECLKKRELDNLSVY